MKKRLTHIAPVKLGLITALCFGTFGLLILLLDLLMGAVPSSYESDYSYNQISLTGAPGSSPPGNPGVHAIQLSNGVVPEAPTATKSGPTATSPGGSYSPLKPAAGTDFPLTVNGYSRSFALPVFFSLGLPLVMGFLFGWIGALLFNLLAKWTGGIAITVEDIT